MSEFVRYTDRAAATRLGYPQPKGPLPLTDYDGDQLSWALLCPECGEMGIDRPDLGGDHASVTVHPDRDDYDSPVGTRGGYVRIDLVCCAGHAFSLIIGNHKGTEVIGLVQRREDA